LKKAGFDEKKITSDAKESKKIFSKFIYFYAGIEDQLEYLVKNLKDVPRDIRWFMGGFLLVHKKEYMKTYDELVKTMPGLRKDISNFLESMIESYGKLKKMTR